MSEEIGPLLFKSETCEQVTTNPELVRFAKGVYRDHFQCRVCDTPVYIGDQVFLVRHQKKNGEWNRVAVFCSILCERRDYFERKVKISQDRREVREIFRDLCRR